MAKGLAIIMMALALIWALTSTRPAGPRINVSPIAGLNPILDDHLPPLPPEYHRPAAWWRNYHPRLVARGLGQERTFFSLGQCLVCHDPATSCHVCHDYIGAARIGDQP